MAPCLCGPGDIVATTPLTSGLTLVTHNENYCGGLTWCVACFLFWPIAFCPLDKRHTQYAVDAAGVRTPYNVAVHGYPVAAVMLAPGVVQMNPLVQPGAAEVPVPAPVTAPA